MNFVDYLNVLRLVQISKLRTTHGDADEKRLQQAVTETADKHGDKTNEDEMPAA